MTDIEKTICYIHRFQEKGHIMPLMVICRSSGVNQGAERERQQWAGVFLVFSVGRKRQGKVNSKENY